MAGVWLDGAWLPGAWLPAAWYESGASDTEVPSAPGTPTITSVSTTSAVASWAAATDNVGVAGYEYRVNGGSITAIGNVLTIPMSALTPDTGYTFEVRAYDAAGNRGPFSSASFATLALSTRSLPPPERTLTLLPSNRRNLVS